MVDQRNEKGFTLVEILLVLVIASSMLLLFIGYTTQQLDQARRDRTSMQMQQILNAALSYYVSNGNWPVATANTWDVLNGTQLLQAGGYLPTTGLVGPIAQTYSVKNTNTSSKSAGSFVVATQTGTDISGYQQAILIAGRLPLAFAADATSINTSPPGPTGSQCSGVACYVASEVNIPGQNLNNARSVNFAAIYSSGACVPVPECPSNMQPQIMVAPVSVSGNYYSSQEVYPISSFTASAKARATSPAWPNNCDDSAGSTCADDSGQSATAYWRVCLSVTTQQGRVAPANAAAGAAMGSVLAITRCMPNGGDIPRGTTFGVWSN